METGKDWEKVKTDPELLCYENLSAKVILGVNNEVSCKLQNAQM